MIEEPAARFDSEGDGLKAHLVSIVKEEAPAPTEPVTAASSSVAETPQETISEPAKADLRISKKALAILVVASVIAASGAITWAFFLRSWSTEDVGDRVINDPTPDAPGFKHSLAGRTITVAGHLTQLERLETNRGTLNLLTLDDYAYIRLVVWGPAAYVIGDHVSLSVRFDWATSNDERHVYSPQIDFPWFYLLSVGTVVEAVSFVAGTALTADDLGEGRLRISVLDQYPEVSTANVNCTLMEGERSWAGEYVDVLGVWSFGHTIDHTSNLTDVTSENGLVSYCDSDLDGNLSGGDWFDIVGTERPSEAGGVKSYMLNVGYPGPNGFAPGGVCYLVVLNDGLIRLTHESPYARIALENRTDGSVEATVVVMSDPKSWDNISVTLSDGAQWETWYPASDQLTGSGATERNLGEVALGPLSVFCVVKDQQGNGLMDQGDSLVFDTSVGSFSPTTNYTVGILWEPTMSQICTTRTFHG